MHSFFLLILGCFSMANAGAQFSDKRQVFIFGQPQSKEVAQQLDLLQKEAAGVQERDIKITLATTDLKWHKKYKVAPSDPFTLILVGKDGGEKFRSQKVTKAAELFQIIDAMPMRQLEMRRGQKGQ